MAMPAGAFPEGVEPVVTISPNSSLREGKYNPCPGTSVCISWKETERKREGERGKKNESARAKESVFVRMRVRVSSIYLRVNISCADG